MKKNFKLYIGLAILGLVSSCKPEIDTPTLSKGTADFSKFVAIGNSLTSGYADNGLYLEGQKVAFPNLIADQMKSVGGGEFTSPFFPADKANGSGYIMLESLVDGNPVMKPVTDNLAIRGANPKGKPLYIKYTDPIQNLGVPGMRLDMAFAPGVGTVMGNPYFERLLPDNTPQTMTYFQYATTHDYTFFSFWLGNNDVLGYATNGAVSTVIEDGVPVEDPTKQLTSLPLFTQLYTNFIKTLTTGGKKGVVATIPDVTAVPFLNTVTTARINAGLEAATGGAFKNVFIQTKTGPRAATAKDLFPLTFSTAALGKPNAIGPGYGLSPLNPVEDNLVLDEAEIVQVSTRVAEFNNVIKQVAESNSVAVADVHAFLNKVKTGYVYNGVGISSAFITGNAFSLDGVHLTPMGNAIVANLFIDAINNKYNASVPKVDISLYRGVKYPN
ncbi:G-D-S-L family lipolytic protein [Sphingobacterium sp. DK4209]|uniref:G-D-S-L family lipolytic protein n=1 Tax=Sphingobacterium zhuxiongii TaxID=2662364 RepID=A0A5Q0QIT9_9SPHI|nr:MULTISPECIES: SGNH/GDSL hydrolase family protein [unclassified Sphingobacterium]MVZ66005.1 G-D-S-L family lipolytic protein [Sphingobacterium sp. DK4209]QGA27540.1 G-D-S-L family lipolytic protein [Sphingobacterium sp. dk4302]